MRFGQLIDKATKKVVDVFGEIGKIGESFYRVIDRTSEKMLLIVRADEKKVAGLELDSADNCFVSLKIPEALISRSSFFKIGQYVNSITLSGDEEIDISEAYQLDRIDAHASTRYEVQCYSLYGNFICELWTKAGKRVGRFPALGY